jgi:hypothetical protein
MTPKTVSELYPSKWLKAGDLGGRAVAVTIAGVTVETFRQPDGGERAAAVLDFSRATKRLILNKTQCGQLTGVVGSERLADWPGQTIRLAPASAPNGKPTIAILPPANGQE